MKKRKSQSQKVDHRKRIKVKVVENMFLILMKVLIQIPLIEEKREEIRKRRNPEKGQSQDRGPETKRVRSIKRHRNQSRRIEIKKTKKKIRQRRSSQ